MQKACQYERCPESYIRKRLFYIKKKSQSDYIISSQNSRIGSHTRPIMVSKDLLRSQNYIGLDPFCGGTPSGRLSGVGGLLSPTLIRRAIDGGLPDQEQPLGLHPTGVTQVGEVNARGHLNAPLVAGVPGGMVEPSGLELVH